MIAVTPNYETIDVSAPNYVETCVAELAKETSIVSVIPDPSEFKGKLKLGVTSQPAPGVPLYKWH